MDKALENKDQANGHRMKTLGRLLKLIAKTSPWMLIISMITIVLAAASNVIGSLFIERLINNYIVPLTREKVPNYGPLETAIAVMFGIYAIGFLSNYLFNMLMGVLAQKYNIVFVTKCLRTWRVCQFHTLTKMNLVISCRVTPTILIP